MIYKNKSLLFVYAAGSLKGSCIFIYLFIYCREIQEDGAAYLWDILIMAAEEKANELWATSSTQNDTYHFAHISLAKSSQMGKRHVDAGIEK